MIRAWLAVFGGVLLLLAIAAHLTQQETAAEALGNVVFVVLVLLAIMAFAAPRRARNPGDPLAITYVTQDDLSKNSGYVHRVDRIARAMRDEGHEVTIVGFATTRPVIAARWSRHKSRIGRLRALVRGFFMPSDVVVITSIGAAYNGWYALALRLSERKVIYDSHDPVLEILGQIFGNGPLVRMALSYVGFLERMIDRCASVTLVGGMMEASLMRERDWRGPMLLFYNINDAALDVPDVELPRPVQPGWESATVVVYVGGLQPEMRGIEAQIEAVAQARDSGADVRLLLVGFGDRVYFEARASELLMQGAASIVADMPYPRLLRMLASCDVAVSSEPWRYGMQTKMFDYLATGVRIVAIDDGRDIVTGFGDLVVRYDGTTDALAGEFVRISRSRDRAERARRREAGLALIRRLIPESHANLRTAMTFVENRPATPGDKSPKAVSS